MVGNALESCSRQALVPTRESVAMKKLRQLENISRVRSELDIMSDNRENLLFGFKKVEMGLRQMCSFKL